MPPKQQTNRQSNEAFGILPNAVARDVRLGPAALVALTYRMTFADTTAAFGLNSTALRRQRIVRGKGLGRDVIEAALRQARDAGYLQRQQSPRRSGRFGYAVDKLALPPCSLVDQSGWIVRRAWFDARLSLNALAAILYMRAGTGKGPIYAHELAARFAWSLNITKRAVGELTQTGWIEPLMAPLSGSAIGCCRRQMRMRAIQGTDYQGAVIQGAHALRPRTYSLWEITKHTPGTTRRLRGRRRPPL